LPELIKKIKSGQIKVDDKVKASLFLYKQYLINIPHDEITLIGDIITSILHNLDKNLSVIIAGSYRRQHNISNDIDIIIIHKKYKTQDQIKKSSLMKQITNELVKYSVLHDTFKISKEEYIGLCKYGKQPKRRIDIKLTSVEAFPTTLLFYTGSYTFIRFMRYLSALNNYKITDQGLFKDNKRIHIKSEADIFKHLRINYIDPKNREATYVYENFLLKEENIEAFNYASWYK
jgi:DNA polymerase/3'-5' exonuclease PolX